MARGSDEARVLFSETIRLPRRALIVWLTAGVLYVFGFGALWAVADMTTPGRVYSGLFLLVTGLFFFVGPLWYVVMHVVIDRGGITRRVGHRRRRIGRSEIASTRTDDTTQPDLHRVVLTLQDGSEYEVLTRRSAELVAALGGTEQR